jgi:hypothetical protein
VNPAPSPDPACWPVVEEPLDEATEMRLRLIAVQAALATNDRILLPSLRDFLA